MLLGRDGWDASKGSIEIDEWKFAMHFTYAMPVMSVMHRGISAFAKISQLILVEKLFERKFRSFFANGFSTAFHWRIHNRKIIENGSFIASHPGYWSLIALNAKRFPGLGIYRHWPRHGKLRNFNVRIIVAKPSMSFSIRFFIFSTFSSLWSSIHFGLSCN